MSDTYNTIADPARAELKEKGSRFIAEAFPVGTEEAATRHIKRIRKREHSATHHCTAYRLHPSGDLFRYDDDGEPSGTAGRPILRQIDARELTNTLVVVTRYFGGTKLGTGGLARAYGGTAAKALDAAIVVEEVVRVPFRLRFAYDDTAPARQMIEQFGAEVREERYTADTELIVGVRRSEAEAFARVFTDALGGRGTVERVEEEGKSPA